jgi:hypothetical protein
MNMHERLKRLGLSHLEHAPNEVLLTALRELSLKIQRRRDEDYALYVVKQALEKIKAAS